MAVEEVHYLALEVLVEVGLPLDLGGLGEAECCEVFEDVEVVVAYAGLLGVFYEFLHSYIL